MRTAGINCLIGAHGTPYVWCISENHGETSETGQMLITTWRHPDYFQQSSFNREPPLTLFTPCEVRVKVPHLSFVCEEPAFGAALTVKLMLSWESIVSV